MKNRKGLISFVISSLIILASCSGMRNEYEVFAINYSEGWKIAASAWVPGAEASDSVDVCEMFWLIKAPDGKNILVDAGFIDSTSSQNNYVRPDSMLLRLNIKPDDISDIILTHPHNDHIGGIPLFPEARVWMQKDDYEYFVGPAWEENGNNFGFERKDVDNIISINKQGRLTLIEGDNIEIFPGIKVFTGSKHTFENQYLLVNAGSEKNRILLASDAIWFYLNLEKELPITVCMDTAAYVNAIRRIKTMVANPELIIPGHDNRVFSKFPEEAGGIVRISE